MAGVLLGYEIGLDDDADVGGIELRVDDGAKIKSSDAGIEAGTILGG